MLVKISKVNLHGNIEARLGLRYYFLYWYCREWGKERGWGWQRKHGWCYNYTKWCNVNISFTIIKSSTLNKRQLSYTSSKTSTPYLPSSISPAIIETSRTSLTYWYLYITNMINHPLSRTTPKRTLASYSINKTIMKTISNTYSKKELN